MRPALVPPIVVAVLVLSAPLSAQQEAKLSASDAGPHSRYGASSAVSGDTLVIGAPDGQLDNTGAAYVYTRSGSTWTEQAKLMPTVPVPDSLFGESVAISGDTIVVGAPLDTSSGLIAGAVYVFERTGTTWAQTQEFFPFSPGSYDWYGWSVAISGDTLMIGASDQGAQDWGDIHVYVRDGSTWSGQFFQPVGLDKDNYDYFGWSIALEGDTALIGAPGHNEDFTATGAVWVVQRTGTVWAVQAELTVPYVGAEWGNIGSAVALSGDTALLGMLVGISQSLPLPPGSAYVFTRNGGSWSEQAHLVAADGLTNDYFGGRVALDGDVAAVSAYLDDVPAGVDGGSVHVFTRIGTSWSLMQQLIPPDSAAGQQFGTALAVDGNRLVVGAGADDLFGADDAGSAYVYKFGAWADLGSGLAGSFGVPSLTGTGTLTAGSPGTLRLASAKPSSLALLAVSLFHATAPFKCGTLVPVPLSVSFMLGTDPQGNILAGWGAWPSGLSGLSLYFQYAVLDSGAVCGVSISNALRGEVP